MSEKKEKKNKPKKAPPLTPNERARIAYKRNIEDKTYLKLMLLKETKLKLNALVADSGGTQNGFFEQLINDAYNHKFKKSE